MSIAFGAPGPFEMILILVAILLLFGAAKLPDLAKALGKSLGEFKKGKEESEKSLKEMVAGDGDDKTDSSEGAEEEKSA
ncbi:twin-arginine translocase TatA/TatE family subunit [Verrucomicrobiota bacterium]